MNKKKSKLSKNQIKNKKKLIPIIKKNKIT